MIAARATVGKSGYTTRIETGDGHELIADEPKDKGGNDEGPTPKELLAAAVASCVSITVRMYAERKEWDVTGLEVTTEIQETERGKPTPISTFVSLPEHLDEEQRAKILRIAEKCPVHLIVEGDVDAPVMLAS